MLEGSWILAEAAVALPAASAYMFSRGSHRRLREALRAPLFWDGGQPVSLATVFIELNGEANVAAAIAEALSIPVPATPKQLEQAVARLQGDPAATRRLVLDMAVEVVLKGTVSHAQHAAAEGVATMERLTTAHEQAAFFAFIQGLQAERGPHQPPLLPIEAILPGGLPVAPVAGGAAVPGVPSAMSRMLAAIGLGNGAEVVRVVEDMLRERQVKKAREQYHKALALLGAAAGEALRRRSPAGQTLLRNVHGPLDAYRNLLTRSRARWQHRVSLRSLAGRDLDRAVQQEFFASLARATTLVHDKCSALERLLLGRHGAAHAGELLYQHRDALLAGLAPDALPIAQLEAALADYVRLRDEASAQG